MPGDSVFDAIEQLHSDLTDVHDLLTAKEASVRLVLTPENVVVAEARRSLTTLSLFGYRVDGVVANRVFPDEGADAWRSRWVRAQGDVLDSVEESFSGLPIWRSAYQDAEPVGAGRLEAFAAAAYAGDDPLAVAAEGGPVSVRRTDEGAVLHLSLPFVERRDVELARHGDELVVTVGSYRRLLALPTALRQHRVVGARIEGEALEVRFAPEEGVS
jgi:arsenite-transporting ATPase